MRARLLTIIMVLCILGTSCTYRGGVKYNLYKRARPYEKIPLAVVFPKPQLKINDIHHSEFGETYKISLREQLEEGIVDLLEAHFQSVETDAFPNASGCEVVAAFNLEMVSRNANAFETVWHGKLSLSFLHPNSRLPFANYSQEDDLVRGITPEGCWMGALSIGSLFLLAPITQPYGLRAEGKHFSQIVGDFLEKQLQLIGEQINGDAKHFVAKLHTSHGLADQDIRSSPAPYRTKKSSLPRVPPLRRWDGPPVPVAILDMDGRGVSADDAAILSDRFRAELHKRGRFQVVERAKMNEILHEQGFQKTGCTSTECYVEMGQIIGVRNIIFGSVGMLSNLYILNVRIVDVSKGTVLSIVDEEIEGSIKDVLRVSLPRLAHKITFGR